MTRRATRSTPCRCGAARARSGCSTPSSSARPTRCSSRRVSPVPRSGRFSCRRARTSSSPAAAPPVLCIDPPPAHPFRTLQSKCDSWADEFEEKYAANASHPARRGPGPGRHRAVPAPAERNRPLGPAMHRPASGERLGCPPGAVVGDRSQALLRRWTGPMSKLTGGCSRQYRARVEEHRLLSPADRELGELTRAVRGPTSDLDVDNRQPRATGVPGRQPPPARPAPG